MLNSVFPLLVALGFVLLIYMLAFGAKRPELKPISKASQDRSLFEGSPTSAGGLVGAWVAGTSLASLTTVQGVSYLGPYVLIVFLGIAVGLVNGQRGFTGGGQ
jgi:Fe2+ transport system protein B